MFVDREGMKEWRNGGVNYIQCRLVEEAERLEAKLTAGTMHQAGRPRLTGGGGRGGGEGPLGPWPWIRVAACDAWESAMGTEAVWVTVADESSWDVLRAVTPDEKAVIRAFAA